MPIYNAIYGLIETYIFGAVEVGSYPDLVCILCATLATIFLVSLPVGAVVAFWQTILNAIRRG